MYPGIPTYHYDVAVVGDDLALESSVAAHCAEAGMATCLIWNGNRASANDGITQLRGECFAVSPNRFALLDPKTGDETAFLDANVLIIAQSCAASDSGERRAPCLGLRKLGIMLGGNDPAADSSGRTAVPNIFVLSPGDAGAAPQDVAQAIATAAIKYCKELTQ